jgi:hypothetical protein
MKNFTATFVLECKRLFRKWTVILIVGFLAVGLFFTQLSTGHYKRDLKDLDEIVKYEQKKVETYINYTRYAIYGISLKMAKHPASILFSNSGTFKSISALVACTQTLDLIVSAKGKNIFQEKGLYNADFSQWIHWIGSFLILVFGFLSFQHIHFYKFLIRFTSTRSAYLNVIMARLLIVNLLVLAIFSMSVLLITANGIQLSSNDFDQLSIFALSSLFIMSSYFMAGVFIGLIRQGIIGLSIIWIIWLGFIFFLPMGAHQICVLNSTDFPSNVETDIQKWGLVVAFEKRANELLGKYRAERVNEPKVREVIESWFTNEYKKMQEIEKNLEDMVRDNYSLFQGLSLLTPSTFYNSLTNNLSGNGFENWNEFFIFAQEFKDKFYRYFVDKKYYSTDKTVQSFVKDRENIFLSQKAFPSNYIYGFLITVLYNLVLGFAAYYRFRHVLFRVKIIENPNEPVKHIEAKVEKKVGEYGVYNIKDKGIVDFFYTLLTGKHNKIDKKLFTGRVRIGDNDILPNWLAEELNFLFVCSPKDLPEDIKTGWLIAYLCKILDFNLDETEAAINKLLDGYKEGTLLSFRSKADVFIKKLSLEHRSLLLMALIRLTKFDIYLLYNTAEWLDEDSLVSFKALLEYIADRGSVALCMAYSKESRKKSLPPHCYILEDEFWSDAIVSFENQQKRKHRR